MKRTRFLIALLVMLVAANGYAQDSYRQAVKEYQSNLGGYLKMGAALHEINEAFFDQSGNVDLGQLTERYIKEVLVDQMTDMVESMMKECKVTEADLRTVNTMLAAPEFQTFLAHKSEWDEKIDKVSDECISQLMAGGESEKIQVNPAIDAVYAAKFQKMWKDSGIEEKTIGLYDRLSLGEMTEEIAKIGKYKTWLTDNLDTIALNAAYGILSLEDIDLGMKLFPNASFRKVTDTSDMNIFSVVGPTAKLLTKYLDWMESQGAKPNAKMQYLKMFQNLMKSPNRDVDEE